MRASSSSLDTKKMSQLKAPLLEAAEAVEVAEAAGNQFNGWSGESADSFRRSMESLLRRLTL